MSMTIDHDFLGKALQFNPFFYLAQCSSIQDDHVIMGKDAKGKDEGKTRTKRVFAHSGSSADAELVEGVWPNQEHLLLLARFFSYLDKMELFLSSLGHFFFVFFNQGLFSAFDFAIGVIVKSFHVGIFVKCMM